MRDLLILPREVIEKQLRLILDFNGSGLSLMESVTALKTSSRW